MIYFDNAATGGKKPQSVLSAVSFALQNCANPGRAGHKLSLSCAKKVQDCRHALNRFFDGYGYEYVAFTKNCTEALNIALFGVLKKGDHVIVGCTEHNSVLRVVERLQKQGVINYDVCPLTKDGDHANISAKSVKRLLKPNTKLVAITSASNVNGAIPPIDEIRAILPKHVLFLCDGAQGGGHLPISMQKSGIDLFTIAGHKGLYGIQGSGALLFSPRVQISPLTYGGTGSLSISLDMPDFYPDCLEAGTLSYPAVISLLEGINFLETRREEIARRLTELCNYCINGLRRLKNYRCFSVENACGIVAFSHKSAQAEYIADVLSTKYDIAVRGGLHCAPLMHEALGSLDDGLVRVSFSLYNKTDEIDVLLTALKEIDDSIL